MALLSPLSGLKHFQQSVLHSVSSSLPEATPLPVLANILRTPCVISKLRYTTGCLQGDADSKRDQSRDSEQTPSSSWCLILGCEMGFLNQKESFGDSKLHSQWILCLWIEWYENRREHFLMKSTTAEFKEKNHWKCGSLDQSLQNSQRKSLQRLIRKAKLTR